MFASLLKNAYLDISNKFPSSACFRDFVVGKRLRFDISNKLTSNAWDKKDRDKNVIQLCVCLIVLYVALQTVLELSN